MAVILSLAQRTRPFRFEIQLLVSIQYQVYYRVTKLRLIIFLLKCGLCKDLFPSENKKCINKKVAGLSSLMVFTFAGSPPGIGMPFTFPFILWSYQNINLTNLTIVISYMGSHGFSVGNNFDCGRVVFVSYALCNLCLSGSARQLTSKLSSAGMPSSRASPNGIPL